MGCPFRLPASSWHSAAACLHALRFKSHAIPALFCPAAYGKVYRGRWNGAIVAVKVIEHRIAAGDGAMVSREPLLWWVKPLLWRLCCSSCMRSSDSLHALVAWVICLVAQACGRFQAHKFTLPCPPCPPPALFPTAA